MIRKGTGRLACLSLALAACMLAGACNIIGSPAESSVKAESDTESVTPEGINKEGVFSVPCFGCHTPENFMDSKRFPHQEHRSMGLHCNQCHIMKGHSSITLNGNTCRSCHDMGVIKLSNTSMPARYDHAKHAAMFDCGECHMELFRMKAGGNRVNMGGINKGLFCGRCHNGKIASAPDNCSTCHSG